MNVKRKKGIPAIMHSPTYKAAAAELKKVPFDQLHEILLGSGEPKMVNLAHCMNGGVKVSYTLTEMCAMNGVKLPDVVALYKENQIAIGTLQQMRHAPDVLESNAIAAIGRRMPCPTCEGRKILHAPCEMCDSSGKSGEEPCMACKGAGAIDMGPCQTCGETGWVQQAGDANALKVFAESAGLTQKAGINVNVNQNNYGGGGGFEDLMRQAERKKTQVVEARAE